MREVLVLSDSELKVMILAYYWLYALIVGWNLVTLCYDVV